MIDQALFPLIVKAWLYANFINTPCQVCCVTVVQEVVVLWCYQQEYTHRDEAAAVHQGCC